MIFGMISSVNKTLPVLALIVAVSGCNSYLRPVCDNSNAVEMSGIHGRMNVVGRTATEEVDLGQLVLQREAKGVYSIKSSSQTQVSDVHFCSVDGQLVVESWNINQGSYSLQLVEQRGRNLSLRFAQLNKILPEAKRSGFRTQVIGGLAVTNNSQLPAKEFVKLLQPVDFTLELTPVMTRP